MCAKELANICIRCHVSNSSSGKQVLLFPPKVWIFRLCLDKSCSEIWICRISTNVQKIVQFRCSIYLLI